MPAEDNRRFVIRDRNWHPKAFTPDYKTRTADSAGLWACALPRAPRTVLAVISRFLASINRMMRYLLVCVCTLLAWRQHHKPMRHTIISTLLFLREIRSVLTG